MNESVLYKLINGTYISFQILVLSSVLFNIFIRVDLKKKKKAFIVTWDLVL